MLEAISTNPVEPISRRFTSMSPLSPLLVVIAALSVAREACFFFSALQAFTQIFSLFLCVCVYIVIERERKKFWDQVLLSPCT